MIVPGFNLASGINLILQGGSNLIDIEKYFVNSFGSNFKRTEKNNIEKYKNLEKNFIPCFGAIKIIKDGWETEAIPVMGDKTIDKTGFFAKILRIHW